jgi:hypothetical protein
MSPSRKSFSAFSRGNPSSAVLEMTWYTVGTSDRTNRAILGICHLLRSKFKANESRQRVGYYKKYFSQAIFSTFSLSLYAVPLCSVYSLAFFYCWGFIRKKGGHGFGHYKHKSLTQGETRKESG